MNTGETLCYVKVPEVHSGQTRVSLGSDPCLAPLGAMLSPSSSSDYISSISPISLHPPLRLTRSVLISNGPNFSAIFLE